MPRNVPAKVACFRCHKRRVRCDRNEGVPCTQCRIARSNCEPILSRRGRHRKLPPSDVITFPTISIDSHNARGLSGAETSGSTQSSVEPNNTGQESNHRFDTRPARIDSSLTPSLPAPQSSGKTAYVTDSSNINYLIQEFGLPYQDAREVSSIEEYLHRAMLDRLDRPTIQFIEGRRSLAIRRLRHDGAFDLPSKSISTALFKVFFQNPFPALSVIDRLSFLKSIEMGTASHLLLNAIYMVATIYCPNSLIHEAGFPSRFVACLTFYNRAKDIYDAGVETDTIAVIQATYLLAHWWSDPLEQKDPWYWLGVTTGMAQALGMHRLKSYSHLQLRHRRLWRRLWWIVYAADINMSLCLDRIPHVRDDFCEIPILTPDDFQESTDTDSDDFPGGISNEQVLFAVHWVQLAKTVNHRHPYQLCQRGNYLERISSWYTMLPSELRPSSSKSIWAIVMQLTYDQFQLLFCRRAPDAAQNMGPGSTIFDICTDITRLLEDLVTKGALFSVCEHALPPVMASLCFHIASISRGDPQVKSISKHRASFCLRILRESESSWPIISSVYPFFASVFRRHSGLSVSEYDKREAGDPQPAGQNDDTEACSMDASDVSEGHTRVYERFSCHDEIDPVVVNSAFPFSYLFEDVFLTAPLNVDSL